MKVCTSCNVEKVLSHFFRDQRSKDGRKAQCKECEKESKLEYYEKRKAEISQRQKQYYIENKAEISVKNKDYRNQRALKSPEALMLIRARGRAKTKNLDFNITLEDIVIPEFCPILALKLVYTPGSGGSGSSPSLDRINPKLGYVKGNVWVISKLANFMKNGATFEQLTLFANWVQKDLQQLIEKEKGK